MKKKILGLDLGVGSIGWALIETEDNLPQKILGMGSRIVPISKDDSDQFSKGQAITKNADRTARRTARKGYNRYQMRRALLTQSLRNNNMLPERMDENVIDLWKLRSDAATEGHQLTLPQIGRVLYHINQKRGYKHSKADENGDSKQTKYVEAVNQRYKDIQEAHQTIGQHFYLELLRTRVHRESGDYYTYRIKDQVFPRAAYIAEFDRIMNVQRVYYPEVLTDEFIDTLRNRIIFYQRPLKSCKHLVSLCEFEMRPYKTRDGKIVYGGPKCAPRTSPLAQLCAMWETANNITLTNRNNERFEFSLEQRRQIVDFLCHNKEMKVTHLQKILGISKKDGWYGGKAIGKGIKGNATLNQLREALQGKYDQWLEMPIKHIDVVDATTSEVFWAVSPEVEETPLFKLWHAVYSLQNADELAKTLREKFQITDEAVIEALCKIDFVKPGYANKSNKFIRRLLPYLMEGMMYSEACERININHSNSMTREEREQRPLSAHIQLLQKNQLRQPVVEKVLNQMINIVNSLKDQYGEIDEARVELARELKQSRDERESAYKAMGQNERRNKEIAAKIAEFGIRPSRSRIQKYKMWEESLHQCFYCGKTIDLSEFLNGADVEIEHIIPRSILFDDSFSNKVCACRRCNQEKGNQTAMEYMETKSAEQEAYKQRVDEAFTAKRISKTKRDHLLWRKADIPADFIERQLRQSQYIAVKAVEVLQDGIRQVWTSGGSVTDFLRHQWGYDEILHTLNLPRYRQVEGLTEFVDFEHTGQKHTEERIKNWSKRIDHRHHAIDALTVALTQQGYIQRLNTLEASHDFMEKQVKEAGTKYNEKKSILEKWINEQPHFSVEEVTNAVDGILVSFRAGKRVTTPARRASYKGGKRVIAQRGIEVPRGALTEETIYGKLGDKFTVKYSLDHPSMKPENIVDPTIRALVQKRVAERGKDAFKDPLYSAEGMEIKSVRCYTSLSENGVVPVKYDEAGRPIGYAKKGNNHHIAIYQDKDGQYQEMVVSFWDAVERKRYGVPVVITNPHEVWDILLNKDLPQEFLAKLPNDNWQFVLSMQENEMFVLGLEDDEFNEAIERQDYAALNKHLYRVQKISHREYTFRYHTETKVDDKYEGMENGRTTSISLGASIPFKSISALLAKFPHKVKVDLLGHIHKA